MEREEREKEDIISFIRKNKQWLKEKEEINKLCARIHEENFGDLRMFKNN